MRTRSKKVESEKDLPNMKDDKQLIKLSKENNQSTSNKRKRTAVDESEKPVIQRMRTRSKQIQSNNDPRNTKDDKHLKKQGKETMQSISNKRIRITVDKANLLNAKNDEQLIQRNLRSNLHRLNACVMQV